MTDATSQPEPVDPGHDPGVDPPADDDHDAVDRAREIDEPEAQSAPDLEPQPGGTPELGTEPSDDDLAPHEVVRPKEGALEASDVTMPGDPNFDETHIRLAGKNANPPPGAAAG